MKSDDGIERINVLTPKTKDFESWKDDLPYSGLKSGDRLKYEYTGYLKEQSDLKEEGVIQIRVCPICEKKTDADKIVMPVVQYLDYYCVDCVDIKEKEEAELLAKKELIKKEEEAEKRKIEFMAAVPLRYSGPDIKESDNKKLIDSTCSILYGGFGTGKTWESYSLIKKLYCNFLIDSYEMVTESGLINNLKSGFNDNSFEKRLEKYKSADLLIVDEMGKSNDSDFNKSQLFEILNYRYDWMKRTVLICNCLEREELVEILNPAIADRFRECIILMDGKSRRYKKNGG